MDVVGANSRSASAWAVAVSENIAEMQSAVRAGIFCSLLDYQKRERLLYADSPFNILPCGLVVPIGSGVGIEPPG